MPKDDTADRVESDVSKPDDSAEERARQEALDSKSELVEKDKQSQSDLKTGKRKSGITGEFGGLELAEPIVQNQAKDGAGTVERNSLGQVTEASYGNQRLQFEYGNDGRVNNVEYPDGGSWRRESDGWQLYKPSGERTDQRLQGDIEVDRQGNYIFTGNDGTLETQRTDGSYRRDYANGGSFERNASNQVTSTRFPDGKEQTYQYSADGNLNRLTYDDGSSWRKEDDGWHLYDAAGQRGTEKLQGNIEVSQQGDYVFRGNDGVSEIQRADGSYRRESQDWNFERNSDGQVTSVHRPDGSSHDFDYSSDGKLNQVRYPDGSSWRRDADGWRLYNNSGERTDQQLAGDIQTNAQGDYTFVHNDGTREVTHANGKVERQNPTASQPR
jgi:YD repeat-containing protein